MEKIIYANGTADVLVPAGQKIAVATYGNEYATLSFKRGNNLEFIQRLDNAQVTLGPWTDARTVTIEAAQDQVSYDVGTAPNIDSNVRISSNPLTGGSALVGPNGLAVLGANYDVLVCGANPGGITAAVNAAREGAKVLIVEPSNWIGGMVTSGISATDVYSGKCSAVIVGIAQEFYRRAQKKYGPGRWQLFWSYGCLLNPNIAEQLFREIIAEEGIDLITGCDIVSASKPGTVIDSVTFTHIGKVRASVFIESGYEGDLIAASGCSFHIGREANAVYGETQNGVRNPAAGSAQFHASVDPYVTPGVPASGLLPNISYVGTLTAGAASSQVQSLCYRIAITKDASIKVPFPEPTVYDPLQYELLGRHIALAGAGWTTINDVLLLAQYAPGTVYRYDVNNKAPISIDYVHPESTEYITATRERRNQIEQNAKNYILGFLKFIQADARVPAAVRADVATYGLIADQWRDYGNLPPVPYVRVGRRLVGDFVMKDSDVLALNAFTDPIAYSYYAMDSHHVQCVWTGSAVVNEGQNTTSTAHGAKIPFRVMLPKVSECTNLLTTFALSMSYAAHCAIRMEPISMAIGGAAGVTAAWAARMKKNVQDMDLAYLKQRHDINGTYRADGGVVAVQFTGEVNNGTTTETGAWTDVYSGANAFVHVGDKARASVAVGATYEFKPNIKETGAHKLYLKWPEDNAQTRSTVVPVTITHAGGTTSFTVNQNNAIGDGGDWFYAGEYVFQRGAPSTHKVTFGTDGVGGSTIVNAIKVMPSRVA